MQNVGLSLKLVWLTISLGIALILATPYALGREKAARLAPVCEWKAKYGRHCAFCGMTTSFLDISAGRFHDAGRSNRGGPPLYLLFLSNELGALIFFGRKGAFTCKY